MLESIYQILGSADPWMIYFALLLIPFIENIFPPAPSDLLILAAGALISQGVIGIVPALLVSAAGSETGFLLLFFLGTATDKKLLRTGKIKFINQNDLAIAESWFNRYGYLMILFNRFIPGVRSVISYFAGVSELNVKRTIVFSCVSAVLWHLMLLSLGAYFGAHIETIDKYISLYGRAVSVTAGAAAAVFIARYYYKKSKSAGKQAER